MHSRFLSTLALWCLGLAGSALAQPRFDFDKTPGNLPKTVVPERYQLALELDPARDDFNGTVDIALQVRQPVGAVVLHARGLKASKVELRQGATVRVLQLTDGPIPQSWWLEPTDALVIAPGRYSLHIAYSGTVNRSGVGLFRAEYQAGGKTERSQTERMLATQLESIDARNVFPSFDEPAFRAVFELTVRAPRGLQVLGNMPQASERADGAAQLHRFPPTPPMPSYLFAVSVGRYDEFTGRAGKLPLRILTAPGKRERAAFAMRSTEQIVPFYNDYFGVPFALPKLDQIAVPSARDGAMEDWGLISYAENALLFDPATSSPRTQRRVFNTVAHEIAHQWFGDLVTAASWEEIWLNEAFATWMASKATRHFNPAWHSDLEQRSWIDETMAGDAGSATRAIRSGPVSEIAVFDVFDNITYTKGGAVLGMLEQWLGEATFRRGLAAYMRERAYSNATAGDLWFHMAQASKRDVLAVAASWTDQPGFPLVEVASECSGQRTVVSLAQRRLSDGAAASANTAASARDASLWQIPVRLARGTQVSTVLLASARQQFELPGCSAAPLLANAGGVGFYRVKYGAAALEALTAQFPRLPAADQVMLLSDSFALAQSGELPLAPWLALLAQLPRVDGPARGTLFEQAGHALGFYDAALQGTPAQPAVREAGRRLLAPELARLGWEERRGDDPQTLKLRGSLIEQLARFDDAPTIAEALRRFDAADPAAASGKPVPLAASTRSQIVEAVGMHADRARFDRLMARFKSAGSEEDRRIYAAALAGGRDPQRVQEVLAASTAGVTTPNVATMLPRLVSELSPFGDQAYAYTLAHWDALAELAGGAMFTRFWLLPGAADHFSDPARAAQLLTDQQRKTGADGAMPAARVAAGIALRAAVRQRDAQTLQDSLSRWRPQ